ncbi:hypothetical protein ACFYYN_43160 [Streptomyces sp. NPDC001902]
MDVRIRLSGDTAAAELVELANWLSREDDFRGRVSAAQPLVRAGQMGSVADVLIVALGAQGVGTVLAASLSTWIRHRRPSADIEVTGADGRGVRVSVRGCTEREIEVLLRQALER